MQTRRSRSVAILIVTGALAVSGAADAFPDSATLHPVCRKRIDLTQRDEAYLLFEATDQTVVAGPGSTEVAAGPEEPIAPGRVVLPTAPVPDTIEIRGERVWVDAVAGAEEVAALVRERGAVLVPWGYLADCRPVPWLRSGPWLAPGARGVVAGTLRPRGEWAGGTPTFDVHEPYHWPYPGASEWSRRGHDILTAEEFFAFISHLPTRERAAEPGVYEELFAWARAHPRLSDREPAGSVIRRLRSAPHDEAARTLEVPLAGTWQLRVEVGERTAMRWIRTASRPERAWTPPGTGWEREGPFGFAIGVHAAADVEDLPEAAGARRGLWTRVAVTHPPEASGDSLVWEARLPAGLLDRALRAEGWGREWLGPAVRRPPDGFPYVPLRIVRGPDGRATATTSWRTPSDEGVMLELERVSDVATGDPSER